MYPSRLFRHRKPVPEEEIAAQFRPYDDRPGISLTLQSRIRGNVLEIVPQRPPWTGLIVLGILAFGPMVAAALLFTNALWLLGVVVVMAPLALVMVWQIFLSEWSQGKPYTTIFFGEKQIFYPRLGKSIPFYRIRRTWICWRYFPPRPNDDAGCYYYFLNAEVLIDDGIVVVATLAVAEAPSLLRKVHLGVLRAIRRHGGPREASTS